MRAQLYLGRAAVVALALGLSSCGGGGGTPTSPSSTTATPREVTVSFRVFNAVLGEIPSAAFTKSIVGGAQVRVTLSEITDRGNVEPDRMVVRRRNDGVSVGAMVGFTSVGELAFTGPQQNTEYDLFLFEQITPEDMTGRLSFAGNPYDCIDQELRYETLQQQRLASITNPAVGTRVGPWVGTIVDTWNGVRLDQALAAPAVGEMNTALNPFGLTYGFLSWIEPGSPAEMFAGYGDCPGGGNSGRWSGRTAVVCAEYAARVGDERITRTFLEEIWESYFRAEDVGDCLRPTGDSHGSSSSYLFDGSSAHLNRAAVKGSAYAALRLRP